MPNGAVSTAVVQHQDRRRCIRRKVLANGEMIPVDLGPLESGLLLDICARGASVQGLKPLRPGVRISLKFRLPGSEVSVQPTYEVIWADRNGKIGLKFLYISEREQRLLDEWAVAYFPAPEREPAPEPPRPDAGAVPESTLATTMTLEQELARVVEQAAGYTSAEGGAIALREEQGIVCRASWGNAPEVGVLLNPDSGLSGECIRTGASISCADSLGDLRVDSIAARQLNLRSALIVPIKIEDEVQGLIEVLSSRPAAFTSAHLTSLERLAEIVGFLMGPPAAPSARKSITVEKPAPSEESVSVPSVEPESVPVAELSTHGVGPAPAVAASDMSPTEAGETDAAGIIQLIEPELEPVPVAIPDAPVVLNETVAPEVQSVPEQAAEVAESPVPANSRPSLQEEPRRGLRVNILTAVVVACAGLLIGAWFVTPRLAAKLRRNTIPAVTASPQLPVTSKPSPSSPAPTVDLPAAPSTTSRPQQQKHRQASADTPSDQGASSDEDDDVTVVTWVNGDRLPANRAGDSGAAMSAIVAPVHVANSDSTPLRVTSQAMLDRVVNRPAPEYPDEARRQRIEGVVTLKVIVGADGRVETATPISGPPILAIAAAKAVAQWRYRPYLLDGKPIRVETSVTVGFRRG